MTFFFDRMEKEIGLTGAALEWLKSCFHRKSTSVCVNGTMSVNHDLEYVLPPGSFVSCHFQWLHYQLSESFNTTACLTIFMLMMFRFTLVLNYQIARPLRLPWPRLLLVPMTFDHG